MGGELGSEGIHSWFPCTSDGKIRDKDFKNANGSDWEPIVATCYDLGLAGMSAVFARQFPVIAVIWTEFVTAVKAGWSQ